MYYYFVRAGEVGGGEGRVYVGENLWLSKLSLSLKLSGSKLIYLCQIDFNYLAKWFAESSISYS